MAITILTKGIVRAPRGVSFDILDEELDRKGARIQNRNSFLSCFVAFAEDATTDSFVFHKNELFKLGDDLTTLVGMNQRGFTGRVAVLCPHPMSFFVISWAE